MNEYKMIVPINGAIMINITAESIDEAVDILLKTGNFRELSNG